MGPYRRNQRADHSNSDNENAIEALKDAAGKLFRRQGYVRNPPKQESQSNGCIDAERKTISGFLIDEGPS